jgi:hypothetical protein
MTMTLAQRETQILSIIGKVTGPNQDMHFVNFTGLLWLSMTQINIVGRFSACIGSFEQRSYLLLLLLFV